MEAKSADKNYVPLSRSTWSWHFNVLTVIGAWVYDFKNPVKAKLFVIYQVIILSLRVFAVFLMLENLYSVTNNIKKLSWNLCTNNVFAGTIIKLLNLYHNHSKINDLRSSLHMDALLNNTPEDILIEEKALKWLRLLRVSYYGIASLFCPIWVICGYFSYLWGEYVLHIPINIPQNINPKTSIYYLPIFMVASLGGVMGVHFIIESEMSMFSLFIQIHREYNRFMKDILKINNIYQDFTEKVIGNSEEEFKIKVFGEINPFLRKIKTKILLKKLIFRQQQLIRYTEIFEYCYNKGQILHVAVTFIVIVFNAILVIYGSSNLSPDVSFQFGLLALVIIDIFLVCTFSQELNDQCREVGFILYSTNWYQMEPKFQKDVFFMIMRSQSPPKLTAGKLMEVNLHTFMLMMKNIYSLIALFRQLDIKVN